MLTSQVRILEEFKKLTATERFAIIEALLLDYQSGSSELTIFSVLD
ncbi:hypothetical protein C5S31_08540 [ANME-1 cluster archaeon GoMg2]|nr:hypothetical protein [ANME-1 cluster archaeon GoMg2]